MKTEEILTFVVSLCVGFFSWWLIKYTAKMKIWVTYSTALVVVLFMNVVTIFVAAKWFHVELVAEVLAKLPMTCLICAVPCFGMVAILRSNRTSA